MNERAFVSEEYVLADNNMDLCKVTEIKKYSYQDFKWHLNITCHSLFRITYVLCGAMQAYATWCGLVDVLHRNNIVVLAASIGLGFVPVIGSGFGIYGAHMSWGWSLLHGFVVFIIPYFIVNTPLLMIAFVDMYKDWLRWQAEKRDKRTND